MANNAPSKRALPSKHPPQQLPSRRPPERKVARTPPIKIENTCSEKEISPRIAKLLKDHGEWTGECTQLMQKSLSMLFNFDKHENALGKAFGDPELKILLNPFWIFCYHPECILSDKGAVTLHQANDITNYLQHVSMRHSDDVAAAIYKRFSLLKEDIFAVNFDETSPSPMSLIGHIPSLKTKGVADMVKYSVYRELGVTYICHWKDALIRAGLIDSHSLSFQEDDALIHTIVTYPNQNKNWKKWRTLALYMLKLYTSVSGTAANLFRGYTYYPHVAHGPARSLKDFVKDINHSGPSVTSLQRWLPALSYDNEQFHKIEILCHLKFLINNTEALKLQFVGIVRYIVVLGIDEQELNQGTFILDNILHGLTLKLTPSDISKISLVKFPDYIKTKAPFISNVREYRLTDLRGIFCSNVVTSFLSRCLDSAECAKRLDDVKKLANACQNCLLHDLECRYKHVQEKCHSCTEKNIDCVSLLVVHVLWDMGSSHKKMAKEVRKIDSLSVDSEFTETMLCSIGFGGLHLLKAITNCLRNCSMTLDGMNYGVHILRSLRLIPGDHHLHLASVKASVYVGKDRQSDYLSHMTSSKAIQTGLQLANEYVCTRSPEPVLTYVDNAKKQKKINFPVGIECNTNGDQFILDTGSACVLILNRSSVAKMFFIGQYKKPKLDKYKQKQFKVKDLKLSNDLRDILIYQNNLFIADYGRGEIIIVSNVGVPGNIANRPVYLIPKQNVSSIALLKEELIVCLCDGNLEVLQFALPKAQESSFLEIKVVKKIKLSVEVNHIFKVPAIDNALGLWCTSKDIMLCYKIKKGSSKPNFKDLSISSDIKPSANACSIIYQPPTSTCISQLSIEIDKDDKILTKDLLIKKDVPAHSILFTRWGCTWFFVVKSDCGHKVQEMGSLSFGLDLSKALHQCYEGISYIPPHGFQSARKLKLTDCIDLASELGTLLQRCKSDCKERFPTLNSFNVNHGSVATETIQCLQDTIESWQSLCSRLDFFDESLKDKVVPFTITNESLIERSFGFTVKKGQSSLQTMQEYIQNKSKNVIDFLIKMCHCPFNQDIKIKLRDKGYQHVHETMVSKISVGELWEVLNAASSGSPKETPSTTDDVDQEPDKGLYRAFLLSKAVPRKSNRAKWKEQSGFSPPMLEEAEDEWKLIKGDMVFALNLDGSLLQLIIKDDMLLNKTSDLVEVTNVESGQEMAVKIDSLLKDKGFIALVPSNMFKINNNDVLFTEAAEEMVHSLTGAFPRLYDDQELAELPNEDQSEKETSAESSSDSHWIVQITPEQTSTQDSEVSGPSGLRNFHDTGNTLSEQISESDDESDDEPVVKKKKICAKQLISEDENSSDDSQDSSEIRFIKHAADVGDYVALLYDGMAYMGEVMAIDERAGYKVKTLVNDQTNCFKWSNEKENIWYENISFVAANPTPANNRGAWKFSDGDFEKFKSLI